MEAPEKPGRQFPGVGVGVWIENGKGAILLMKRTGSHAPDTWCLPGGWVELNEHPFASAVREAREETGLIVEPIESMGWINHFFDEGIHSVTLMVRCQIVGGEIEVREPEKCTAIKWVHFDNRFSLNLFPGLAHAITATIEGGDTAKADWP